MNKLFYLLFLSLGIVCFLGIMFTDNVSAFFIMLISFCMALLIKCFPDKEDEEVTYKNVDKR